VLRWLRVAHGFPRMHAPEVPSTDGRCPGNWGDLGQVPRVADRKGDVVTTPVGNWKLQIQDSRSRARGTGIICEASALPCIVIPAKAGVHLVRASKCVSHRLDSRLRGNDRRLNRGRIPSGTNHPRHCHPQSRCRPSGRRTSVDCQGKRGRINSRGPWPKGRAQDDSAL
jgi:hypothetical protein